MKPHVRFIGLAAGVVSFEDRLPVPLCAVVWRNPFIDHFFVRNIPVDPPNLTQAILDLIPPSIVQDHHIKALLCANTIMAGLGILDLNRINNEWDTPVIALADKRPDNAALEKPLAKLSDADDRRAVLARNPSSWVEVPDSRLWVSGVGMSSEEQISLVTSLAQVGNLPEPVRLATLLARSLPNRLTD